VVPLAHYREQFWHPDGSLASGDLAHIFPRFSNIHSALFADQAGTVPLPNPLNMDANGFLDFYVDNGDIWVFAGKQAFYVIVELDETLNQVWPSTYQHNHTVPATMWTINHGLESHPAVSVLVGGQIELADVVYIDLNSLTIEFATPTVGIAYLRR
jgi:hypothetical protein